MTGISIPTVLQSTTHPGWFDRVRGDLAALLSDHLHCERKAAENALSLVRRYPHDRAFVETMSRLAHEETSHVIQVAALMDEMGLVPRSDTANHYTRALFALVRGQEPGRRVDLLLVAGFIEARSHERLRLLADGFARIADAHLAGFYTTLANAEERHAEIFWAEARRFSAGDDVDARIRWLGQQEAAIVAGLPGGARIH